MKRIILASAIALAFTAPAFAGTSATTAGGFSNINVNTSISGNVTAVNGGFSESQATDNQTAFGSISSSASKGTTSISGQNVPTQTVGTVGTVGVTSNSSAWNYSTGNAGGSASVVGGAGAIVSGTNSIPGVAAGSGYAGVGATEAITAGTNEGGYTASVANANFGSTQTYNAINSGGTASTGISSALTAGATVSNTSGVMTANGAALSAPDTLSIGNSGTFTATGTGSAGVNTSATVGNSRE